MRATVCKLCQYAVEGHDGTYTLAGIYNRAGVSGFPAKVSALTLAIELEFEPAEGGRGYPIRFVLVDEDGQVVWSDDGEIETSSEAGPRTATFWILRRLDHQIEIPGPGFYRFDIFIGEEPIGETRFYIEQA